MNEKYIENISTLFSIKLIPIKGEKENVINGIIIYPSLKDAVKNDITLIISESNKNKYTLKTTYNNGFDFYMWKSMEEFTKHEVEKKKFRKTIFQLKNNDNKIIAIVTWFGKTGYKINI